MGSGDEEDAKDSHESMPPNARQMIFALRQIGYGFEQAVSDLIDNSIDARAKRVLVRFVHDDEAIVKIQVVDDGHGMTDGKLKEAMRFGAHDDVGGTSLGKFGMGLKVASLSHARTLSVYTKSGGVPAGRRWTVESIARGWLLDRVSSREAADAFDGTYQDLVIGRCGTVVEWEDIDRLPAGKKGVVATVEQLVSRLRLHLGLHFHRFIETRRVSIKLDVMHSGEQDLQRPIVVSALNPFNYQESGAPGFPAEFCVDISGVGSVRALAHVWPPNSSTPEYKLGNRAAARQGLYFYRHDRLIQAGGWNGVVEQEAEPHGSLARVAIDLPELLDSHFGLDIKKSGIEVPPSFSESLQRAKTVDGTPFPKYRAIADKVYRKKDERGQRDYPFILDKGLPAELSRKAKVLLGGGGRTRSIAIEWVDLSDRGEMFEIDRDAMCIRLDRRIRKRLLGGRRASVNDLPLVKILFFLLLEQDFDKAWVAGTRRKRLDAVSELIAAALKFEE